MKRLLAMLLLNLVAAAPSAAQVSLPPGYTGSVFAGGLRLPDGIVLHPNGYLYVADETATPNGGIWKIAPDGTVSRLVTGMNRVDNLALDWRTGELIASEESPSGNNWRLSPDDGSRSIEVSGTLSVNTEGLAYDYATMVLYLVEDRTPGRVQAWDGVTLVPIASGLQRPEGVAVDITGELIVAETASNRVLRIDPATGAISDLIPPGTAIQPDNVLYHPFTGDVFVGEDQYPGRILRVRPDGQWSVFASGLASPQGMFFAPDGRMFVSEQSRSRVLVIEGFLPALRATSTVPVGGTVAFALDGGATRVGLGYRLFLSTRGSYPGTRLDTLFSGDRRRAPFNLDPPRRAIMFTGSTGTLDASGQAAASLSIPNLSRLSGRSFQAVGVVFSGGVESFSSVPTVRVE